MRTPRVLRPQSGRHTYPWNRVAAASSEHDLKQLHPTRQERRLRSGQVEMPGTDKRIVEVMAHLFGCIGETLQPVLERLRVVEAEVLDVQNGQPLRLEHELRDLAQRRRVAAGENALSDPGIEGRGLVAPDEVQQAAAVRAKRSIDH